MTISLPPSPPFPPPASSSRQTPDLNPNDVELPALIGTQHIVVVRWAPCGGPGLESTVEIEAILAISGRTVSSASVDIPQKEGMVYSPAAE